MIFLLGLIVSGKSNATSAPLLGGSCYLYWTTLTFLLTCANWPAQTGLCIYNLNMHIVCAILLSVCRFKISEQSSVCRSVCANMNECEWLPSVRGCLMADPMENPSSPSCIVKCTRRENSLKRNVKKEEKFWKQYVSIKMGKVMLVDKSRCFEKVGQLNVEEVFQNSWELGDWYHQSSYLIAHMTLKPVKKRQTNNPNRQRSYSCKCLVVSMQQPIEVFVIILGFSP